MLLNFPLHIDPWVLMIGCLVVGAALELITAQGTAIGATIAALTATTGDSLAIRNSPVDKRVRILQLWTAVQVAGKARVRSPNMHDNTQGIRIDTIVGDIRPLLPWGAMQRVYPNDTLIVELAGSAVVGDIEYVHQLLYYEELPGIAGRFGAPDDVLARTKNIFTVENTITTLAAGGYSGGEAINAEFDQFHAGGQYALLGYLVDVQCGAVGWRGADTGNLRVAGPGEETERELTADWFVRLSRAYGVPLIPIFSAENKGAITVDCVQNEDAAAVTVTSIFAELAAGRV